MLMFVVFTVKLHVGVDSWSNVGLGGISSVVVNGLDIEKKAD